MVSLENMIKTGIKPKPAIPSIETTIKARKIITYDDLQSDDTVRSPGTIRRMDNKAANLNALADHFDVMQTLLSDALSEATDGEPEGNAKKSLGIQIATVLSNQKNPKTVAFLTAALSLLALSDGNDSLITVAKRLVSRATTQPVKEDVEDELVELSAPVYRGYLAVSKHKRDQADKERRSLELQRKYVNGGSQLTRGETEASKDITKRQSGIQKARKLFVKKIQQHPLLTQ